MAKLVLESCDAEFLFTLRLWQPNSPGGVTFDAACYEPRESYGMSRTRIAYEQEDHNSTANMISLSSY